MTDALALGEKLLALLEEPARTTTYKPALLLALIDRAQEYSGQERIPVRALAERVVELYWPQTLAYPTTGHVLKQRKTSTGRAAIVQAILAFRGEHAQQRGRCRPRSDTKEDGATPCAGRGNARRVADPTIAAPIRAVPLQLRLGLGEAGGWSVRAYRTTGRAIRLYPGVGDALTALGPLLRPSITRWWTDKAATLNPDVEAARSVLEFEDFLFGRDRVALERIAEGLLDLQSGTCFYCQPRSAATARSTTSSPGPTAATTGSTTWSPPATAATTANAPPSPAPGTSPRSSGATKPGTRTSPHCPSSVVGHATPTARTGSPALPICAPPASDPSGYAPEPE